MKKNCITYYLACILMCILLADFNIPVVSAKPFVLVANTIKTPQIKITYKIIKADDNTWGYDIYMDNKKVIHQPNIPGVSSNKGFSTEKKADKAAKLIVKKIKLGQMPPTVSLEELRAIKAL
jgi:preprotein translocase subunit SecD